MHVTLHFTLDFSFKVVKHDILNNIVNEGNFRYENLAVTGCFKLKSQSRNCLHNSMKQRENIKIYGNIYIKVAK